MKALAMAMVVLTACSFATVNGPRSTPGKYLECTTSRVAPITDLVAGSVLVAGGLAVAYYDRRVEDDKGETGTKTFAITLPAIAVGVLFLVASQYGASRVTRCRAAVGYDKRWQQPAQ
jgi:hypothetical protein